MIRASLLMQRSLRMGLSAPSRRFASSSSSSSSSSAGGDGFFKSAWNKYQALLESHPMTTKVATAGVIAGAGDVGCQLLIERNERIDIKRACIFTAMGGFLVAPVLHVWYGFLGSRVPGVSNASILKRLALDQLGFAPTFMPIFFSTLLTLEGIPETIPSKLRAEWWPTVQANWIVWVPAQLLNFRFVPGNLQVLFANVVGLFWNSYLSYVSHTDAVEAEPVAAKELVPSEA